MIKTRFAYMNSSGMSVDVVIDEDGDTTTGPFDVNELVQLMAGHGWWYCGFIPSASVNKLVFQKNVGGLE